jgi:hypothetical protein
MMLCVKIMHNLNIGNALKYIHFSPIYKYITCFMLIKLYRFGNLFYFLVFLLALQSRIKKTLMIIKL